MRNYFLYILADRPCGKISLGVTDDLERRISEYKNKENQSSAEKSDADKLVYYEKYDKVYEARVRAMQLKSWKRDWKVELIEKVNPAWNDLYYHLNA